MCPPSWLNVGLEPPKYQGYLIFSFFFDYGVPPMPSACFYWILVGGVFKSRLFVQPLYIVHLKYELYSSGQGVYWTSYTK